VTSKPDFKVMVLLLVFMQLTRDLFAITKFLFYFAVFWWGYFFIWVGLAYPSLT